MNDRACMCFTEMMHGYVTFGEHDERRGFAAGRAAHTRLIVQLTITIEDMARFVSDREHVARVDGSIKCDALGGTLPVEHGTFHLFGGTQNDATTLMTYRLLARDSVGHPLTLWGTKRTRTADWWQVWPDTTTLYTRVLAGHIPPADATAPVIAAGILRITPRTFAKQLTTFRATGAARAAGVFTVFRFGVFFAQQLWRIYGASMRRAHGGDHGERPSMGQGAAHADE